MENRGLEQKKPLTLGSLFDGSGGFPLAGILAGVEPVWASEIEPFAIRVTTKRLPKMWHYGDVSDISGADLEPVDIITFGSPCQDLSIAGKRSGLDGSRSGLFFEAVRIVKEMREKTHGEKPRFIVWENVPGAFSSNKGEDFKAVLEEVIRIKEPEAPPLPPPEKADGPMPTVTWETDGAWHTAFLTLNTGASPNEGQESFLSQILQADVPQRFYLSRKACLGILRRASARGKALPEILKKALEQQAERMREDGDGSS